MKIAQIQDAEFYFKRRKRVLEQIELMEKASLGNGNSIYVDKDDAEEIAAVYRKKLKDIERKIEAL